jgi:hypothetical protein
MGSSKTPSFKSLLNIEKNLFTINHHLLYFYNLKKKETRVTSPGGNTTFYKKVISSCPLEEGGVELPLHQPGQIKA